jgi:hypothetical protein
LHVDEVNYPPSSIAHVPSVSRVYPRRRAARQPSANSFNMPRTYSASWLMVEASAPDKPGVKDVAAGRMGGGGGGSIQNLGEDYAASDSTWSSLADRKPG